jgi:hypothetical protein
MVDGFGGEINETARRIAERSRLKQGTPADNPNAFLKQHSPEKPKPTPEEEYRWKRLADPNWYKNRGPHPAIGETAAVIGGVATKVAEPVKEAVKEVIDEHGQKIRDAAIKTTVVAAVGGTSILGGRAHHRERVSHRHHGHEATYSRGIGISGDLNYVVDNRISPPNFKQEAPQNVEKLPNEAPKEERNEVPELKRAEATLTEEQKIVAELTRKAMAVVPDKHHIKKEARIAIPLIIEALREEGLTSNEVLAYALATTEWESKFHPGLEIDADSQANDLNYSGGARYAGRGYVQLTHDFNYQEIGAYIGYDLLNHPEMAEDPEIAARVLAAYFKLHGTVKFAENRQYLEARRTINGGEFDSEDPNVSSKPYDIEDTALLYLAILN